MNSSKPIKAMVVDDAAFMRKQLVEIISSSDEIDVIGVAKHGKEALEAIEVLKPDVITLDVDMPVMDGITTIKHIMIRSPVPVVMVSGLADQGKITFEALRLGAIDFFPKPSGTISKDLAQKSDELIKTLKVAANSNLKAIKRAYLIKTSPKEILTTKNIQGILVIIAGQGSISSAIRLMSSIRGLNNLAILCLQDLAPKILSSFGKELGKVIDCTTYEGRELNLSKNRCILLSEMYLPILNKKENTFILKGRSANFEDFFSSLIRFSNGNHQLCVSILGGKAPSHDSIKTYEKFVSKGGHLLFISPEKCACRELSLELEKAGLGKGVCDEYEMLQCIKTYSRRLILEGISKT